MAQLIDDALKELKSSFEEAGVYGLIYPDGIPASLGVPGSPALVYGAHAAGPEAGLRALTAQGASAADTSGAGPSAAAAAAAAAGAPDAAADGSLGPPGTAGADTPTDPQASFEETLAWMDETTALAYFMSDIARQRVEEAAGQEKGEGEEAQRRTSGVTPGASTAAAAAAAAAAPPSTGGRGGLRTFSLKVCEKVEAKGETTYQDVADELVHELANVDSGDGAVYDEKNIRRRVYDALNVLMALKVIEKDKKTIYWKGMPSASRESELDKVKQDRKRVLDMIDRKQRFLSDLCQEYALSRNLLERNREREGGGGAADASLQIPFLLFSTDASAQVEVQFSDDLQDVYMDFFEHPIHLSDEKMLMRLVGLGKEWPVAVQKHYLKMQQEHAAQRKIQEEEAARQAAIAAAEQQQAHIQYTQQYAAAWYAAMAARQQPAPQPPGKKAKGASGAAQAAPAAAQAAAAQAAQAQYAAHPSLYNMTPEQYQAYITRYRQLMEQQQGTGAGAGQPPAPEG